MSSAKRNSYIELLRFLFCIMILLHHSGFVSPDGNGVLPSGGVIADAFFMLTGYFACAHIAKNGSKPRYPMGYSVKYTLDKMMKVLPFAGFGIAIIYILEIIHLGRATFADIMNRLYYMVMELLLLPMAGVIKSDLGSYRNAPLWFLSAMFIALPIVMYIAIRFEDVFKHYLVWFLPLFIQGWMVVRFGGALPWMDYAGIMYSGVIRAFASLTMGFGIYYASSALSKKYVDVTKSRRAIMTLIELLMLLLLIINTVRGVQGYEEIGTLYIIYIMLIVSFSGMSYTSDIKLNFFNILGGLSMPIYCMHWGIYRWVSAYMGNVGLFAGILVTLGICIVISICLLSLSKKLQRAS